MKLRKPNDKDVSMERMRQQQQARARRLEAVLCGESLSFDEYKYKDEDTLMKRLMESKERFKTRHMKWTASGQTKPLSTMHKSTYEDFTLGDIPETWRNIKPQEDRRVHVNKEHIQSKLFYLINKELKQLKEENKQLVEQNKQLLDAVNKINIHLSFRPDDGAPEYQSARKRFKLATSSQPPTGTP